MKKNYNQPIVATEQVRFTSLMQGASPAGLNVGGDINDPVGGD